MRLCASARRARCRIPSASGGLIVFMRSIAVAPWRERAIIAYLSVAAVFLRGRSHSGSAGRVLGRIGPMSISTVLLIVLCNMMSFRASKILISLFALELGASQFYIGIMIAMYSVFPALLAVYAGKLSDRLGVRPPMLAGSLGVSAGLLLPWLLPSVPTLYVSGALIGASHMLYNVATQNLIGSLGGPCAFNSNFNYSAMLIGCVSYSSLRA